MMKIISGGQTGADRAALDAWRDLGFPTGGYAPKGWRTDTGFAPDLLTYGLIETDDPSYPYRTQLNVENSDATLIFGRESPGTNLTMKICKVKGKMSLWIVYPPIHPTAFSMGQVFNFLQAVDVKTLNVAGNRERTNPGIYRYVYGFITSLGKRIGK